MDTQVDQVPIRVANQTDQRYDVGVDFLEVGRADALVSTTVAVGAGEETAVYAEPITEESEYTLSVSLADTTTENSISGGGLRAITVDIHSADSVEIGRVDM
jgi:hypothetical protein